MNAVCEIVPALHRCTNINSVNLAISDMTIEKIGELCRRYCCGADDLTGKICDDLHIAHENGEPPIKIPASFIETQVTARWNCPQCGLYERSDNAPECGHIDVECKKCGKVYQVEIDAY